MSNDYSKTGKPSPIGRLISRIRHRSPLKTTREKSTSSKSDSIEKETSQSTFRRTLKRLSFSKKHRIDKVNGTLEMENIANVERKEFPKYISEHKWLTSSPRPALSENDLRHVTIRRETETCITPLAGVTQFMSEDNLAECGSPLKERVPSYMKISYTLNGYRSPRPAVESTPIRPAGKSLIERRLSALRGNTQVDSQTSTFETSPMGSSCSSPSVKNLIGRFNKLNLCNELETCDSKENIKPNAIVAQPQLEDITFCKLSASTSNRQSEDLSKESSPQESARSGESFKETLSSTRHSLEERSKLALLDLDNVSNIPDNAAESIRRASGKAALLIKKKLAKFEELVNANLNPQHSDKLTTTEDLEGFWALVEIELCDINNCFSEVENWRARNYQEISGKDELTKCEKNNNEEKKNPTSSKPIVVAKPLTEKQKIAAEQRRKAIAEAKAKVKQTQEKQTNSSAPGLLIL